MRDYKKAVIGLIICVLIFLPRFSVFGEEPSYDEFYRFSEIERIEDSVSDDAKSFFEEENIDIKDYNWINNLKTENIILHIIDFLKSGAKGPIKSGFLIFAVILMAAAIRFYQNGKSVDIAVKFAMTLAVLGILFSGVWGSITAAVNAVKSCSSFMLSFVPVYMGILSVSGAPATAAVSGGMILFSAEVTAAAAAFGQSAVIGAYLALCVGSSVSPILNNSGLAETFKKTGIWFLTLLSTVFLGLLGAKSAVNSAADSMSVRTAKYILGTCVPVAGNALSGAVNSVSASLAVLKSSMGIYGIIAVAVMLLPILSELLIWRLVLLLSSGICEIFSVSETAGLLKAIDGVFALLVGAVLIVGITFIISLSVVVSTGKGL